MTNERGAHGAPRQAAEEPSRKLIGFHAVREALRAGTPLRYVAIRRERRDARTEEIAALARAAGVAVRREAGAVLARWAPGGNVAVAAEAEAKPVLDLEDLLGEAKAGFLLALDGIEDPQNLGAVLRSACAAGVDGVILPARRAAGLTPAVERVAAGALEHVRVARVGNLAQALEACREKGYWIIGLDAGAARRIWEHDMRPPTLLVLGAEGRGLHELTRKRCDALVSLPLAPGVESLNASAAAAIALFEVVRQRGARP